MATVATEGVVDGSSKLNRGNGRVIKQTNESCRTVPLDLNRNEP